MKITYCDRYNNNFELRQKQNLAFSAGLTPKMLQEIQRTDVLEISIQLAKKGMPTDFKGNKVVAWCCGKTVQILQQLNERFRLKLPFPKGIYVEDFRNLRDENPLALGTCNLRPSEFRKNSIDVVPSRTVFFNSIHNWNNINAISDEQYSVRHFSTNFFLYAFLHEFSHVIHEDKLLTQFGGKKLEKILERLHDDEQLQKYRKVYGDTVRKICDYAGNTPLDAVACDMPVKIIASLDRETLAPVKNPFIGTAYEKGMVSREYSDKEISLQEILRHFWNGKFE